MNMLISISVGFVFMGIMQVVEDVGTDSSDAAMWTHSPTFGKMLLYGLTWFLRPFMKPFMLADYPLGVKLSRLWGECVSVTLLFLEMSAIFYALLIWLNIYIALFSFAIILLVLGAILKPLLGVINKLMFILLVVPVQLLVGKIYNSKGP